MNAGGIDLPTLLTTAIASAAAAYVTAQIWAPGTLAAAAFTPVLVALLKEMLARPAKAVTRAVPVRGAVRSAPRAGEPDDVRDTPEAIEERIAQLGEAPGSSRPGRRRRNWQIAVVTGLLGFIIAAVIITVPELIAGNSVAGGGRDTTFFSKEKSSVAPADTTTNTTTTPGASETETVPPASTLTVPPPAEAITVPPPAPTPVPEEEEAPPPAGVTPEAPATPESPQPPPG